MCKRLNRLVSQSSIKPRLMRFDNGKQNRALVNGRYWYQSPFNHRLKGNSKPKTQIPKNFQTPILKVDQEPVLKVCIVGHSLGFRFWSLGFPPQRGG